MIKAKQLTTTLGDHLVLDHFNFTLKCGEKRVLIGQSGAGKTVFGKHLIRYYHPDSGDLNIDQKIKIGYLFQHDTLLDQLSLFDNIALPMKGLNKRDRIEAVTTPLKLTKYLLKPVYTLPPGIRKIGDMMRTLLYEPDLMILDEPTTGLDDISAKIMIDYLKQLDTTLLIITHRIALVNQLATGIDMIHQGKNYFHGTVEEMKQSDLYLIKRFIELS